MNDNDLFLAAAQIEDPHVRASFLNSVCQDDAPRRERIEKSLADFEHWQETWDQFADKVAIRLADIDVLRQVDGALGGQTAAPSSPAAGPLASRGSQTPGTKIGRYDLLECLGIGGMGEVYLALDRELDRKVALKILPVAFTCNPKWVQRFRREAQAASGLNHPNILTIYEIDQIGPVHFMAMEFIDGVTLRQYIVNRPLDLAQTLNLALQISDALAAAHSANMVHRDIKPENIMVRHDGLIKILDFGLAKQIDSTLEPVESPTGGGADTRRFETEPGMLMGTVRYMSPEQTRGLRVDVRTDIFSFGVLLFELLAGELPFDGPTASDAMVGILEREPAPLNRFRQDIPAALERIIAKALKKDREQRYHSARELHRDLKQLQHELERITQVSGASDLHNLLDGQRQEIGIDSALDASGVDDSTVPDVRYAQSGSVNIAFQVFGTGEFDLVL